MKPSDIVQVSAPEGLAAAFVPHVFQQGVLPSEKFSLQLPTSSH
jgi:hypothetical protein